MIQETLFRHLFAVDSSCSLPYATIEAAVSRTKEGSLIAAASLDALVTGEVTCIGYKCTNNTRLKLFRRCSTCEGCGATPLFVGVYDKGATSSDVTQMTFAPFVQRPDGTGDWLSVEHMLPQMFWGNSTQENLKALCDRCNRTRGNSVSSDYEYLMDNAHNMCLDWIDPKYVRLFLTIQWHIEQAALATRSRNQLWSKIASIRSKIQASSPEQQRLKHAVGALILAECELRINIEVDPMFRVARDQPQSRNTKRKSPTSKTYPWYVSVGYAFARHVVNIFT